MVPREAAILSTTVETFTLEADVKDLKRFEVEAVPRGLRDQVL